MKKYFSLTVIICLLILNFSFAQDLEPFDQEREDSILTEETNYEMELVFEAMFELLVVILSELTLVVPST